MRLAILIISTACAAVTGAATPAGVLPADIDPMDIRAALGVRGTFFPEQRDRVLVDACSIESTLGTAAVTVLMALPPTSVVRMWPCGTSDALPPDAVVWQLSGAASFSGGRTVVLTVDVLRGGGRAFHRELYQLRDHAVEEISLSGYGMAD